MRSSCNLLLVVVLAGVAIAVPVLAQQPSDYPAACEASKVTKADVDRAHTVFLSGKQFLEEANYDKAISYFKDAYSIDCSVHAILPVVATAYERKGDKAEAVRALEEYERRAPNAPDHDVLLRRIKNLKDQIARDQQATTASAAAPPASASSASPPQPVAPPSAEPSAPLAPPLPSAPPPPGHPRGHGALPWVVVGLGGAALATGAILYVVGAGDVSATLTDCPQHNGTQYMCKTQAMVDRGTQGNTFETVGAVVGGGGLALVAAGLVWHFLEKPDDSAAPAPPVAAHMAPAVAPGYVGVAMRGSF
jgi:hypothetical protein